MSLFRFIKPDRNLMGEEHPHPEVGAHHCELLADTDYGMYQQIPSAPVRAKCFRIYRKLCLPTYMHPKCKHFYRSRFSIVREWGNVAATNAPCIVHPFSRLSIIRETVMLILWFILYLYRPYHLAFFVDVDELYDGTPKYMYLVTSIILLTNVYFNFVTGYVGKGGKVVLDFHLICINYLRSYCIFDLLDALPAAAMYCIIGGRNHSTYKQLLLMNLAQLARLKTFFIYFGNVMHVFHFRGHTTMLAFIVAGLFLLHWNTCVLYAWPQLEGRKQALCPNGTSTNYIIAFQKVNCHFFHAASTLEDKEIVPIILTLISGFVFRVFVVVCEIAALKIINKSETKAETFVLQVTDYLNSENISVNIMQRVDLYFRHKYGGQFTSESNITNVISVHLRNEIFLHSCSHLIANSQICRHLRREHIGELIMDLEPTFFLAGDVLFKNNDELCDMYLVSYGKTAVYTDLGVEMLHFVDGAILGIAGFIMGKQKWTIVAIESTEAFIWYEKDARKFIGRHKSMYDRISSELAHRVNDLDVTAKEKRLKKNFGEQTNINLLLQDKILERNRLRNEEFVSPCTGTRQSS